MRSGFSYSGNIHHAVTVVLEDINLKTGTEPVSEM
jgi:hypothetical protein